MHRWKLNPVVLGSGKPLFTKISFKHKLDLRAVRTFGSGVVALHYIEKPEADVR